MNQTLLIEFGNRTDYFKGTVFLLNQLMKQLWRYRLCFGIVLISLISWLSGLYGYVFPIELFSHFQVQYLILSLLLLFGLLISNRNKKILLIAVFTVTITAINIVNWYFPLIRTETESAFNLRILVYNVAKTNQNYEKALAMIKKKQPNLAVFFELNQNWIQQFDTLDVQFSNSLYPETIDDRGIAIYSQFPLENTSTNLYGRTQKTILSADIMIDQKPIHLIATHPAMPLNSFDNRNREFDQISTYLQSLNESVIVAGDLNTTMWSPYYRDFVAKTGLTNTRQAFGIIPTWPAKSIHPIITRVLSIPIDHCLKTPDIQVKSIHTGDNAGSDHFPLIVDLLIPNN